MKKTCFFSNVKSLEELKKMYFRLAKQHHPDRGGSVEVMQKINAEYDEMLKYFEKYGSRQEQQTAKAEAAATPKEAATPDNFKKIVEILLRKGIEVEIIGVWLWVAKPGIHLNLLKKCGFQYSTKHRKYYLATEASSGKKRATKGTLNDIRYKYGSTILKAEEVQKLA